VIFPTEEKVAEMLKGTSHKPDEIVGKMPEIGPYESLEYTVEQVAVNAVMAGAKPEYLPVIITAMECLAGGDSWFSHMMSSEGSFTLMIMVSGPLGKEINMNSGVGLLGHGWQANNTIGRAVRLSLINLGYLWPGELDMALIGRPSSHTFYTFAENMKEGPWESFNEGLGYKPEDSCVTLSTVGGAGMGIRMYGGGVVEPWNVQKVLDTIVADVASDRMIFAAYKLGVANAMAHLRKHIMVIHPELAIILKRAGYLSQQFNQYLRLVGIRHITASPFHPQTNGKIERYHRTLKGKIGRVPHDMPSELKEAIMAFIEYYNYRRYHEGLGNVTPYDVYTGRHLEIIRRRKEAKSKTLEARRDYNRTARDKGHRL
jgi:hypothetical protein